MKCYLLPVLLCGAFLACRSGKKDSEGSVPPTAIDSFLITDSSWGPIGPNSQRADLDRYFGKDQTRDERICGPECADSLDVTQVYPDTDRAFTIYWADSQYHRQIDLIRVMGERSRWHTADSVTIGTRLDKLVRLNGGPLSFWGFGWDYGGYVSGFNGGNWENTRIGLRLDIDGTVEDGSLYGDTQLGSDRPSIQKIQDRIWVMELSLRMRPVRL